MKYLLDTGIIDDHLYERSPAIEKINQAIARDDDVKIDGIAYYERRRGLLEIQANDKLQKLEGLISSLDGLVMLDKKEIFEQAANIWLHLKNNNQMPGEDGDEDSDILIGANARLNNFTIVTKDDDFDPIPGVTVENWADA